MKTLEELGFKKQNILGNIMYGRFIGGCSQLISFNQQSKEWAISSKDIITKRWQVLGLTIEETEAILNKARELFGG